MKLTDRERAALEYMAAQFDGQASGYRLKRKDLGDTGTLRQLAMKGCVRLKTGYFSFPENAQYVITDQGRKAVGGATQ